MKTKNKKASFIQFEGSSEENNPLRVRFMMNGFVDDNNNFTGIIHGYEGGGEYSEGLVYKNKFLPNINEDGECIEWDTMATTFKKLSGLDAEKLLYQFKDVIPFDDSGTYFIPKEEFIKENSLCDGSKLCNLEFNITPIDYANTTFENPIKTWDFDEIKSLIKQKDRLCH
ncbi:MAG: hypothetical protein WC141_09355 [Arcobacteraceae bacterium]